MAKTNQDATKKTTGPEDMSKEELVAAVIELQKKNEAADARIEELTDQLKDATESGSIIESLKDQLSNAIETAEEAEKSKNAADGELEAAQSTIQALQSKLEAFTDPETNSRTFKSEGLEYEILVAKLRWKGETITAEQMIVDDKLREEILAFAWEGRTEADFHKNGIFKINY